MVVLTLAYWVVRLYAGLFQITNLNNPIDCHTTQGAKVSTTTVAFMVVLTLAYWVVQQ